jgi:hypothetical protein
MKTQSVIAGHYYKLHALVYFAGVLSILLALDVVYASLLVHSYAAKQLAAHRERQAGRRLKREMAAAVASASAAGSAVPASSPVQNAVPAMDTDMQQAA